MLNQGKELAAIDFAQVIGAPLEAVIKAQASAAQVTTNFIEQTAFEKPETNADKAGPRKLRVATFDYGQMMGSKVRSAGADNLQIKVPLLTMIPIPFIRVDSMSINFNVSLHSTHTVTEKNVAGFSSSVSGSENLEFEKTSWKTSITDQNTYQNNSLVDDTYSLNVTVHAVQDQMPSGMKNVLDIFTNVIQQQSALIQQVMSQSIEAESKAMLESMKSMDGNNSNNEEDQ